jgi:xanthine dehydrogenase YagS FAD-binding subunit
MAEFAYLRPSGVDEAAGALSDDGARPMGGGTDLVTQQARGIRPAGSLVDLRGLGLDSIDEPSGGLRLGATTRLAEVARHEGIASRFVVLHEAASAAASPQLREMGTVAGNLCQQVRCWYFRHPDLQCWLRGGDTCYAQIGDHRKHGLEPGDCISVAPSDLAAALLALDATVETNLRPEGFPLAALYRKADEADRTTVALSRGEFVTAVAVARAPDASAYERAGERHAWSFALAAVAAARFGDQLRLAAIGVSNLPRLLDPGDPLAGLPGLEQTAWKRRLLAGLAEQAAGRVRDGDGA